MVSIIIPYYNRPEKLRRCIDSLLRQTHQNFEILVIDDCSIIPLVLNTDPRIKIYRNSQNLGSGISRNIGLDNANGKYIAFLDSDDFWDPKFLETCLQRFENLNVSMVFTNGYEVDEDEKVMRIRRDSIAIQDTILPNILKNKRQWGTGGCLWEYKYLKNVRWQAASSWEDYAFDIDVAINCNKISGIKDCLISYDSAGSDKLSRQNQNQAVSGKNQSLLHISKALWSSDFRFVREVKNSISIQLINNLISIKEYRLNNSTLIFPIILELKKWNGFIVGQYLYCLYYLPCKFQLRALRHLKRKLRDKT